MTTNLLKISILAVSILVSGDIAIATESLDASKWSLRYLARASNALLVANDASLEKQPNLCKIPADQVQKMTMNLKILIDQKIANLTQKQKQIIDQQVVQCEQECSCDIYSLVYEKNESPENQKVLTSLNEKASQVSSKERQTCASRFREFCTSQLKKALLN